MGGCSIISYVTCEVFGYAGFGEEDGFGSDADVLSDAHLTVDNDIIFYDYFPCYGCLGCDEAVFPDYHSVTDVYLTIYFGSLTDDGITGDAFIDGASGGNIHVVLDDDSSGASPFFISRFVFFEIEGVGSY